MVVIMDGGVFTIHGDGDTIIHGIQTDGTEEALAFL